MLRWSRRFLLLAAISASAPQAAWAQAACGTVPTYAQTNGGFGIIGGVLYDPDGNPFTPHGIGVMWDSGGPSAAQILAKYPGTNFVRLAVTADQATHTYPTAASMKTYINDLTSHGIFVEIEDHTASNASNRGGNQGYIFSGQLLKNELAAYSDWGKTFASNAYVGFGTTNEPSQINQATGQNDPAALSAWQRQIVNAVRGSGNNGVVWYEVNGWADPNSVALGTNPADYVANDNTAIDMHVYPWTFSQGATQAQVNAQLASYVAMAQQRMKSTDGSMPVDFLEFGDSTDGLSVDANWKTSVQAVLSSETGYAAWMWGSGNAGDNLLGGSQFASMVQAAIAKGGSTACPEAPAAALVAPTIAIAADGSTVTIPQSTDTTPEAGSLSIDQVAALAASMPSVTRTAASPGGTSPTPPQVSGGGSESISDDYAVSVLTGNNKVTVSGQGVTLNATAGQQAVTLNAPGAAVTLGPYNDTVTVTTQGNTINTGGGTDTVILAYGNPTAPVNADAPAVAPLGTVGNIITAPAPGTGVVTIQGTLAQNDRLDLTPALAGSTWDHQADHMWQYITAADSASGCTISVGGVVVAKLTTGAPSGQLGSYIIAH